MGTSIRAGCVPIKQQFNTELVMKIQDYFFLKVQHILSSETTWFVVLLAMSFSTRSFNSRVSRTIQ